MNRTSAVLTAARLATGNFKRLSLLALAAGTILVLTGLTGCQTASTVPPDSAFIPEARVAETPAMPMATPPRTPAEMALDDFYRTNSAPPAFMKPDNAVPATATSPAPVLAGGATTPAVSPATQTFTPAPIPVGGLPPITLREGDTIKVSFPAAAHLNTVTQIRRDGIINLPLIGEVRVAGMTTADLEKDLMEKYKKELVSNQVTVAISSSTYFLFVTGCVMKPGKVAPDRPLSLLEAIMEAGGFDEKKASKKNVRVNRMENGKLKVYTINVKKMLDGGDPNPFMMMPNDIVIVKENLFNW